MAPSIVNKVIGPSSGCNAIGLVEVLAVKCVIEFSFTHIYFLCTQFVVVKGKHANKLYLAAKDNECTLHANV